MLEEDNKHSDPDKSPLIPVEEQEIIVIKKELVEALELYQGEDKDEIMKMLKAKSEAGEFTLEFGQNILKQITGMS